VHPRAWAFGIVVEAIIHGMVDKTRLETADRLLRGMVGEISFDGLVASEQNDLLSELWPSQELLVSPIRAWRKSGLPDSKSMREHIKSIAIQSTYPRLYAMHLAMKTWETSLTPEAVLIVDSLLDRLLQPTSDFKPTKETFAIVMRTWMVSKEAKRGLMVEYLLLRMRDLRRILGTSIMPNDTHFGLVLDTWQTLSEDGQKYLGKHGLLYPAQHACLHLKDVLQSRQTWADSNYLHYSSCLKAWTRQVLESHDTEIILPAREAAKLLDQMEYLSGAVPPAPHCNMVIQSCLRDDALLNHKREVYDIAMKTFNKGSHDNMSFILVVDFVKKSFETLEKVHLKFIESIVRVARDEGKLTQALIFEAVEVLGREQLKKLFHFSDSYARIIERERSDMLGRPEGKKLVWKWPVPQGLKLQNLPRSWSRRTDFRKSYKNRGYVQEHSY
jgi:hypothetical protein